MSFDARIPEYLRRVESALDRWLPVPAGEEGQLYEGMRYSVLGGGKRIRPLLVYATGEVLGIEAKELDGPAAAVELVHAYSLVHDDLPAMDDDELRRGKPTTHRAFGEATAILVGDALLTLAFNILSTDQQMSAPPAARLNMIGELSNACGYRGLAGGQMIDLTAEGRRLSADEIERMHLMKTAVLIKASVMMACHACSNLDGSDKERFATFGTSIGLAFQIRDDVLDIEGPTEIIGKQQGADEAKDKATFPAIFGIDEAKRQAEVNYEQALDALAPFAKRSEPLRTMADYILRRDR